MVRSLHFKVGYQTKETFPVKIASRPVAKTKRTKRNNATIPSELNLRIALRFLIEKRQKHPVISIIAAQG